MEPTIFKPLDGRTFFSNSLEYNIILSYLLYSIQLDSFISFDSCRTISNDFALAFVFCFARCSVQLWFINSVNICIQSCLSKCVQTLFYFPRNESSFANVFYTENYVHTQHTKTQSYQNKKKTIHFPFFFFFFVTLSILFMWCYAKSPKNVVHLLHSNGVFVWLKVVKNAYQRKYMQTKQMQMNCNRKFVKVKVKIKKIYIEWKVSAKYHQNGMVWHKLYDRQNWEKRQVLYTSHDFHLKFKFLRFRFDKISIQSVCINELL